MGFTYTIKDQQAPHFITFTVHQWVDVFTRQKYIDILLNNLVFCQENKGLEIYGYVVMSNHCHLIVSVSNGNLSDIVMDFKKFTAKAIFRAIEQNPNESRKEWLLKVLNYQGRIWFWEEGYHGSAIYSLDFFDSKQHYIHQNPVRAGIVEKEEEYLNSSAGALYGLRSSKIKLSAYGRFSD